jgi:hypothetical protein
MTAAPRNAGQLGSLKHERRLPMIALQFLLNVLRYFPQLRLCVGRGLLW